MEPARKVFYIPSPKSTGGMDFSNISIDLTFNTSSPTQTVMVPILNDMVPEDSEYFSLTLTSNDPAVTVNPATADVNVLDDIDSMLKLPDVCNSASFVACIVMYCSDCFLFHSSGHNWIQPSNLFCS